MPKPKRNQHIHYIDKKLLFRLRIFVVIFLVMLVIDAYEVFTNQVNPLFALVGIIIGAVVGFILGRTYKLEWGKDETKIVGNLDKVGVLFLVVYIAFSLLRGQIFGHFAQGSALSVLTLGVTSGTMLGRVIFARKGIQDILKAAGLI